MTTYEWACDGCGRVFTPADDTPWCSDDQCPSRPLPGELPGDGDEAFDCRACGEIFDLDDPEPWCDRTDCPQQPAIEPPPVPPPGYAAILRRVAIDRAGSERRVTDVPLPLSWGPP